MSKSTKLRSRLRSSAVLPLAAIAALTATGTLAAPGAGTEKVLYTFTGEYGNYPTGNIVRDTAGNLYGTTAFGGDGLGIVFELSPDGKGGWTYNVIYNFTGGADGAFPESGVIIDSRGNLYGTAVGGGEGCSNCGTVFELSPQNGGAWSITKTYSFTGEVDGSDPQAGVALDAAGNVYGATDTSYEGSGYGSIYELTPSGNGWQETTVYRANSDLVSLNNLTLDRKGNVYGTTIYGGTNGMGYVFKFHPGNGGWKETVLHNFGDGDPGGNIHGSVVLDKAGNVYGTTAPYNGTQWTGAVFELTRPSQGKLPTQPDWPVTILYQFTGGTDGGLPYDLTFDKKGDIYGPAATGGASGNGTIYELTPPANNRQTVWTESTVYNFIGGNNGCGPGPGIIFDRPESMRIYGAAASCGANGNGVIFDVKR
jgi:uncharacterized repeat protein (TIGR03803 family)